MGRRGKLKGINSRLVYAAVVENEGGVGEYQARLLGLQIELDNLVVTYRT